MNYTLKELGQEVKASRERKGLSQDEFAKMIGHSINRSNIAHLEQGLRCPKSESLEKICKNLEIAERYWKPFTNDKTHLRIEFESELSELYGSRINIVNHDKSIINILEDQIFDLFAKDLDTEQTYFSFCRILVFYNIKTPTQNFFKRYLGPDSFKTIPSFSKSVGKFQKDAIRLFSSFSEAYQNLNSSTIELDNLLLPLQINDAENYRKRTEWECITKITDDKLPNLGYIAASRVKKEKKERKDIGEFLLEIAQKIRAEKFQIEDYNVKTRRKMDSLLRKFNSKIDNGLFSPLFRNDADTCEKEAKFINPENDSNLLEIEATQETAYKNLANYLSADFMDVYVATSMRSDADFVSVNDFVNKLFQHEEIRPLRLRYFNPTQSWIEDRVAKGLVEALMLKRANFCIYMAQKEDTFGKDSEASVSLGQGKPVIVYVPKLLILEEGIDSESFGLKQRNELLSLIESADKDALKEVDESSDIEALHSTLLQIKLKKCNDENIISAILNHWADFDLYGEIENRIKDSNLKTSFRKWLDEIIKNRQHVAPTMAIKEELIKIFVATSMRFERRAKVFREVHPLALQVILSTGVLNGILVTRSIDSSAKILRRLITNDLSLKLESDSDNYKLIEETSQSTIRVISRNQLLSNSFSTFYSKFINK